MNKREFNKCVSEAKKVVSLLRLTNAHRIKVADIALRACHIQHGGKADPTRFTLRDFAEKIGINAQTVSEWVRYKQQVYDKLTSEQQEVYGRVSMDTMKYVIKDLRKDTPEKVVQRKFRELAQKSPIESKHHKYMRVMDTIIYNMNSFSRAHEIPEEIMDEYQKKARVIAALTSKFKEFKGTKKVRKQQLRLDWDKFWEKEVQVNQ